MKDMLKDPDKWRRESERYVEARGTHNYKTAAEILHDLREAIGGDEETSQLAVMRPNR